MMEGVLTQKITPLLKCVVLFLFIFTAKVLTSRPQDSLESKNSIHHLKPSYYVRTFTKYHHRRTIPLNNAQEPGFWQLTQDQPKHVNKRSIEDVFRKDFESGNFPRPHKYRQVTNSHQIRRKRNVYGQYSKEFVSNSDGIPNSNDGLDSVKDNKVSSKEKTAGKFQKPNIGVKEVPEYARRFKIKRLQFDSSPKEPKGIGPTISCLYKIKNVKMSAPPIKIEEKEQQNMVHNEDYEIGEVTKKEWRGETVEIEQCANPRASCYTLWHQDNAGNVTILGQGCWKPSARAPDVCVSERVSSFPATGFCTCSPSLCNANTTFILKEPVTMKAEAAKPPESNSPVYVILVSMAAMLLVIVFLIVKLYCRSEGKRAVEVSVEKGDVMGSGPDSLATGLSCVDNLTLIEHIGQGKFGSVWRGCLGSTPVAVKIYSNVSAWQKEAAIYALPGLAHNNLLKYYGSDTRPALAGGREHLIVLELCTSTLRQRLIKQTLSWQEFAHYAHGLASALAHLHTATNLKPAVAHRDVTSNNVLVTCYGVKLSDLDLAHTLPTHQYPPNPPTEWLACAGTARYLPPEALEGALDAASARAALHAADVYAAGLVLWEMLWRTSGAHPGPPPPYMQPYQHVVDNPTMSALQNLVSRNKVRPPLPKGPVHEQRALRIACDTCEECWDHDAEARLTAVCVEERMSELKIMLQSHGPVIHDNNLHPNSPEPTATPVEPDKNSNCTSGQICDVTTPLLYPHPHIGRNALIERNTHTNTPTNTVQLIHKSLKDITVNIETPRTQNVEQPCLSVARINHNRIHVDYENSDRLNEIRSYQRPLDYVQNDVSNHDTNDRGPKRTNLLQEVKVEKPKWGIKKLFEKTFNKATKLETEVKLIPETNNGVTQNGKTKTTIVNDKPSNYRPPNLVLNQTEYNFEPPCTLSPPNKTLSPNMIIESENRSENRVFGFKELPTNNENDKSQGQIFAVIVPKAKPSDFLEMRTKNSIDSSDSITKSVKTSMSSQSIFKSGQSESEDSTIKKRLSCDNKILSNSGGSSRNSINLELQYIDHKTDVYNNDSPFDINSDCSTSEDENLMLLSEGSKITMHAIPKSIDNQKKTQNEVLKEASTQVKTDFCFNKLQNKYSNFDNEFSDPNDKENLANTYSGDNPVYLAALNGEIDTSDLNKYLNPSPSDENKPKSPKPSLKNLTIKRQRSLEQVSEIFTSAGDLNLQNPAGRVKTPGDLPVAVRRARRDRVLQKGRSTEGNRLSLYDDRMMFGNSL